MREDVPKIPREPTVRDIPPGTFWAKNASDQWVIQRMGTGEQLAASADLRRAIVAAYAALRAVPANPIPTGDTP